MSVTNQSNASPGALNSGALTFWTQFAPFLPWLVLLVSLMVTVQLWQGAINQAQRDLHRSFNTQVQEISRRIEQRMLDYEQGLSGVRGLFAASQHVDREEFRAYVSSLKLENIYPGVQSVGWVPMISASQKQAFIAMVRREGFPEFTIQPPGDRDVYAVVQYIEPFSGSNLHAFGYDHFFDPVRRHNIELIRDSGKAHITSKVKLAQDAGREEQAGFYIALPIYKNNAAIDTLEQRRANYLGLVGSSFRMDDLMHGIFKEPIDEIDIEIYDGKEISSDSLMFDAVGNGKPGNTKRALFHQKSQLLVTGHPWTLVASSLPKFEARLERTKPRLIAGSGLATGVLLALLTWLWMRGRLRNLQAAMELSVNEAKLRAILDTAMDAVVQIDAEGVITGWSGQAASMFGWSRDEALGQPLHELIVPKQFREAHQEGLRRYREKGELHMLNKRIELMALRRNGGEFHVELTISQVQLEGRTEFCAFIKDITEQKHSDALIWKQANFDQLTHLPNRHMFHERLEQEILNSQRTGLKLALLFIDLDRFKEVNDTLGHNVGDQLLTEVALRLAASVRKTDLVARLGGDEFTVILSQLVDAERVDIVANNILRRLSEPFSLNGELAYVSASMGITLYPEDSSDVEQLLMNADQAMYAAKKRGRNRFSYFTPSLKNDAQERLRLINDLRVALAENQFEVHFHPIVDLKTGRIVKAEALLRWQHPQRGMAGEMEIIPLAEETGLIIEIGDWVFREAARWASQWREICPDGLQIGINMSPVQFQAEGDHIQGWLHYLQELKLPGNSIVMEITEGVLLHVDSAISDILLKFRDAGIQVSIDDFGTGYSALSYLKKFDIDYLKIDLSFVRDLEFDPNDRALSEAIIIMAHKLGLKVIAEGVETEGQRALLAAAGCDYAQGYLFSRPIPPQQLEALLRQHCLGLRVGKS